MIHIHMYMQVLDWYINYQPLWGSAFWLTLWKPISGSKWQVWVWLRNCPHTWVRLCYAPLLPTLPTHLAQRSQVGHVARFPRSWLPANSAICPCRQLASAIVTPSTTVSQKNVKSKKVPLLRQIFSLGCFFCPTMFNRAFTTPLGFAGIPRPQLVSAIVRRSCTQMCREASYALSRLKKLEARGSSRHTVVIGHEHWSCVASCALAVQELLQNVQYGYIEVHLRNISGDHRTKMFWLLTDTGNEQFSFRDRFWTERAICVRLDSGWGGKRGIGMGARVWKSCFWKRKEESMGKEMTDGCSLDVIFSFKYIVEPLALRESCQEHVSV